MSHNPKQNQYARLHMTRRRIVAIEPDRIELECGHLKLVWPGLVREIGEEMACGRCWAIFREQRGITLTGRPKKPL